MCPAGNHGEVVAKPLEDADAEALRAFLADWAQAQGRFLKIVPKGG